MLGVRGYGEVHPGNGNTVKASVCAALPDSPGADRNPTKERKEVAAHEADKKADLLWRSL